MCLSPHEMSTSRIEQIIQSYKERLADPQYAGEGRVLTRQTWAGSLENYEKLLKERADRGTLL